MRILLISAFFPPEIGSAAHLFYELGQALKDRGHRVSVLTGLPRYHVISPERPYRRRPFIIEKYQGMEVFRIFNLDIPWNIPFLRGLDQFISAFFAGMAGVCLPPFDAAVVYSPPLPLAVAAWGFCRLRRRPLIVNLQDLFPQSVIDLGLLTNPRFIRLSRAMESFLYRHADLVTVHSEGNRRHVLQAGGRPELVKVIHNWLNTEAIRPRRRKNSLRADLGLDGHFLVSFAGIMGYSQDLGTVLETAKILKDYHDISFLLVGDGVEKPNLERFAQENQLKNIIFLPMQPMARYPEVLAASDVCLATLRPEVKTPVVPSKILSIMAAGRPVLASLPLDGDAPWLIGEVGCGVAISPGDPEAMAQAIIQLYQEPRLRGKMGARGRQFAVRHLSSQRAAATMESFISQI